MASARPTRSLRVRITAAALVVIVAVLGVAGVGLIRFLDDELRDQVDERLRADADLVQGSMEEGLALPGRPPERVSDEAFAQVIAPDGTVVYATPTLEGLPPLTDPSGIDGDERRLSIERTERHGELRLLAMRLGPDAHLVLGRSLTPVHEAADSLGRVLLIGLPLLAVALGALIWFVVDRALRPVEQVRQDVAEISDEDVSRRLAAPGTADELERLVVTMNSMLDRVERAVAREQRLVADASHELRTPLAGVRALLETEPNEPGELSRNRAEALATLQHLQDLADDLLDLSQAAEAGRDGAGPVDLDELVLRHADQVRRTSALNVDTSSVSGGQVVGRENDLDRLVSNLASNGAGHAASNLAFALKETDGWVELVVTDDGRGVPEAERDRIFERFTRLDTARTREGGGAGLGLAIAATVVAAHDGSIRVEDAPGGGARFVVRLPANAAGAQPPVGED